MEEQVVLEIVKQGFVDGVSKAAARDRGMVTEPRVSAS